MDKGGVVRLKEASRRNSFVLIIYVVVSREKNCMYVHVLFLFNTSDLSTIKSVYVLRL